LKKLTQAPSHEQLKEIILSVFLQTNKVLLEGEINTELSGSTVVGVAIYSGKVLSFNVGDSRAILIKQVAAEKP
jgi:serine/threonine protein phosphatase PrpC